MPNSKNLLSSLVCGVAAICLNGCSPVPYANVGLNVPMLKEAGEVNINASYGSTEDAEGIALQAAAAVSSSVSVMASYYHLSNLSSSVWDGSGNYVELGFGKFGRVTSNAKFIYDAHIGIGSAGIKNRYEDERLDVKFIKPFLQGSIGFNHKIIDVALTSRFAVVNFNEHSFFFADPAHMAEANVFFQENKSKFVVEPGITVRVGFQAIRLSLQYCYSTFDAEQDSYNYINPEYFSIGVNALIGKRWNKKNE